MKILICITGISGGGSEQSLAELVPGFVRDGIEVHIAYFVARRGDPIDHYAAHGVPLHLVEASTVLGRTLALRKVIRQERPDLVHTTLFDADIAGRLATWGTGVPVLTSLVNDTYGAARRGDPNVPSGKLHLARLVDGLTARHLTAHLHANSESVRDSAVAHLGVRIEQVTVVHRGRDLDRLGMADPQRRRIERDRLGIATDDYLVVTAGRQEFQKGHADLLEAVARAQASIPGIRLVVAGREGAMTRRLRADIDRLGLSDRVTLLGHSTDVPGLLQAADLFAFPSLYEGMPGAVLEAMALGLPIVASDIAPIRELLGSHDGVLVSAGDPASLAQGILDLEADRSRARHLGAAARERFLEEFSLDRSIAAMIGLYRRTATGEKDADAKRSRPRLVHVTTVDLSLELLLGPQLRAFSDAGYEVIGVSAPGPYAEALTADGIDHVALGHLTRSFTPVQDLRAVIELYRLFRRLRPDIVHTHNPKPGWYGRPAARAARVPLVVNTQHGLYTTPESRWATRATVYALERASAACSDVELVQNSEDLETLAHLGVPREKLRLLRNGVDLDRFDPARVDRRRSAELRAELDPEGSALVVGAVGRLVHEKGYPELFDAVADLREEGVDIRLVVAGPTEPAKADGVTAQEIQEATAAGVTFLGMVADVETLYSALDIYVLASHREGFPRSAMEAAAMGRPIIATDVRGCRQVVDDGTTGILVTPRSAESLASALRTLGAQPDTRRRLGAAARRKALAEFDQRHVIDTTLSAYGRRRAR